MKKHTMTQPTQPPDLTTRWFGPSDQSALARVLGQADPPAGERCAACTFAIAATDSGIVGTAAKPNGAFKPRLQRFALHARCIAGAQAAPAAARPAATTPPAPDVEKPEPIGKQYRDWERDHPDERPPFDSAALEALEHRRDELRREYAAIKKAEAAGENPGRRSFAVYTDLMDAHDEIRAAKGSYRLPDRADSALEETVTNRIRLKAVTLALAELVPGFDERYSALFDVMIDRDYDPLYHRATHAEWSTAQRHADWVEGVGRPIYGLFQPDEATPADDAASQT